MERVAIAGLSLHQTDVEGLERAKRGLANLESPAAKGLADRLGASEAVLLSTCNRLEFAFARETGHAPGHDDERTFLEALGLAPDDELAGRVFLHTGRAAARHLLRVSASLDSLVVGEDQILAQLRAAHVESRALGLSGHILGPLFEQAIQLGKHVRTATDLSRHAVSVVSLGVAFLNERLGPDEARIAVIGAGATGAHAARALVAAGRAPAFVVNRTPERARALAGELGAGVLTLDELRAGKECLDAVVTATSAPDPVLDAAALGRLLARLEPGRRLLAVDLALPRDLEPIEDPRLEAIDLEALRAKAEANRRKRAAAAAEAELMVEEKLAAMFREQAVDTATGRFATVAAAAREAFELELAALMEGRLAHLQARDRQAIERWARLAFGRIGHLPFQTLKQLARADALPLGEWEGLE